MTAAEEHDVHGPGATEAQARGMPRQTHSSAVYPTAISGQEDPATPCNDPFFAVYFFTPPHAPEPVQAVEAAASLTLQKGLIQLPFQWDKWERLQVELLPLHNLRGRHSSLLLMGNGGRHPSLTESTCTSWCPARCCPARCCPANTSSHWARDRGSSSTRLNNQTC